MIETTLHIEELLLDNDCVIVPGLGGFIAQDYSATYVEEEEVFLPPYRSVSFNPRLAMNDGLLANSISRKYDVSYEKALEIIENDVKRIRQLLQEHKECQIQGVGTLYAISNGSYDFKPLACGIAAPDFYGIDCCYISTIKSEDSKSKKLAKKQDEERDVITLRISKNVIHYVAAAAIAAVFYFVALAPLHFESSFNQREEANMLQHLYSFIMPSHSSEAENAVSAAIGNQVKHSATKHKEAARQTTAAPKQDKADKSAEEKALISKDKTAAEEKMEEPRNTAEDNINASQKDYYTIVVASAITKKNASVMVEEWKSKGLHDAIVYENGKMVRVIYGTFDTEDAARSALIKSRSDHQEFKEAWIYHVMP